ncbi:MAG: PRTRC system protein B [Longimicrobiales bacterium]
MNALVQIGRSREFHLRHAVFVYQAAWDGSSSFALTHDVLSEDGKRPRLAAGQLVTMSFLQELAKGLGEGLQPEVLPPNVLCRTPHVVAWWTPACTRPLFFRHDSELGKVSGKHFPVPALVWRASGRELHIRALQACERPGARTPLYKAPFWNTNKEGLVCQGSMKKPERLNAGVLTEWEDGYFAAEFTHVFDQFSAKDATAFKGGIIELWRSLAGPRGNRKPFPVDTLVPAKQTLEQFVAGKDDGDRYA